MPEPLVVIGAGGFGREVLDVVVSVNAAASSPVWTLVGVADDAPSTLNLSRLSNTSTTHLGGVEAIIRDHPPMAYVVGIGSPTARRRIVDTLDVAGWRAASLVHPAATLGSAVLLGEGTIVCAGARVTTNVRIGRHCHLDTNVTVGHDSVLGDFVRLNPGSSVSGDCFVDEGSLIGAGAVVSNGRRVGREATVGASACVVRDVPDRTVVKGVPAR